MMDFWKSVLGMMEVELTSADPGSALTEINQKEIPVYRVMQLDDLSLRFEILRRDYRYLSALAQKRGDHLRIHRKLGLFWRINELRYRPILLLAVVFLLFLVLYVPTRVLFVRVEGNASVPSGKILEAAEHSGIHFWSARREVRSERVKNALLSALPELQWAGVNTSGCVAVISVRERTMPEEPEEKIKISSIVAIRDGVVDSCTAASGNLLCRPGQAVKAGEVLISAYTDCGIYVRATRAEGEVYALTRHQIQAVTPTKTIHVTQTGEVKHKISLLLGKKRIILWKDSGIWDTSCGRMYEEYYVTLPGDFALPMGLAVETYFHRQTEESEISKPQGEAALMRFSEDYLLHRMVAGKILSRNCNLTRLGGVWRLTADYVCHEMIGRVQPEQIGENYVEAN